MPLTSLGSSLSALKVKLQKNEEVTQENVKELGFSEYVSDDVLMVPVDRRGVGEDFVDIEQLVEKLGPKGTAVAFIQAAESFVAKPLRSERACISLAGRGR